MAVAAKQVEGLTFIDLYAQYPRLKIDVEAEQKRLLEHDVIVFQFPIFWYSTPSILKEWQDLVLEFGFAYGHDGDKLKGKKFLIAATAGRSDQAYSVDGDNKHSLRTFLKPLELTAELCQMQYIPPFILHASLEAQQNGEIENHAIEYGRLLNALSSDRLNMSEAISREYLNISQLPINEVN